MNRSQLEASLKRKDMAGVLAEASAAITSTEAALTTGLKKVLADVMAASAAQAQKALKTLRAAAPSIKGFSFDKTNPKAVEWVQDHAAETIKGISDTTRQDIADLVESAFEEQFDVRELASQIESLVGDDARAETIARTETMRASNEGQKQLWDQATVAGLLTGDEKQEWIVTPDDRLCPICEPMDGETTPLDGKFRLNTGESVDGPPAHPNCRCTIGLNA